MYAQLVQHSRHCLAGDKTVAMWLFDAEIYTGMSTFQEATPVIERGMALHKIIHTLTMCLGGEAWLEFIGNECATSRQANHVHIAVHSLSGAVKGLLKSAKVKQNCMHVDALELTAARWLQVWAS